MRAYYLDDDSFSMLADRVAQTKCLIGPVKDGDNSSFKRIASRRDLRLDYTNSVVSPKFVFLPQLDELLVYDVKGGEAKATTPGGKEDVVLLGVRPCDSSALSVLDKVMGGKQADPYYSGRRQRTLIISLSCSEPREACFCDAFGAGPFEGTNDDITLTRVGNGYIAVPKTRKGAGFIKEFKEHFRPASRSETERFRSESDRIKQALKTRLSSEDVGAKMDKALNDDFWQELSWRCVECGVCSFVCPACYCFDVVDEAEGSAGSRSRGWDSCQFCTFSKMAGGLDPRPTKADRLRHRFYHKLQYVPRTFGVMSCVGCGRCVMLCPSNIDIREVIAECQ